MIVPRPAIESESIYAADSYAVALRFEMQLGRPGHQVGPSGLTSFSLSKGGVALILPLPITSELPMYDPKREAVQGWQNSCRPCRLPQVSTLTSSMACTGRNSGLAYARDAILNFNADRLNQWRVQLLPRYKQLSVRKVDLSEFEPRVKERKLSARQVAQSERYEEIRSALNEAASLPASQAVVIEMKEGQKVPTLRAAVDRVLKAEPRDLNWGIRGQSIVISKGPIPGRRGRRHSDAKDRE